PMRHLVARVSVGATLALAAAAMAVSSGPPPARAGDLPAKPRAGDPARLEKLLGAVEAASRDLPRDTFDPKAVLARVGPDPGKLFVWVRDETSWVPYRGALRGAPGVLMDRLGNGIDRALLLGELLRE